MTSGSGCTMDTCPGLPQTFLTIPEQLGHPYKSEHVPGTSRDILGCPITHDYQSPRSKDPKKSWDNLGGPTTHDYHSYRSKEVLGHLRISRDVLPDMTTIVPGSNIPRSPGTTWEILGCPKDIPRSPGTTRDIPGCPTSHDYHSPRSKYPKKSWDNSGYPGMSYHT